MRVLVCGDRNWPWAARLRTVLEYISPDIIMEGEARGADRMAARWAVRYGIEPMRYPADWDRYGLAAGPRRNAQMLREGKPDLVAAFHDRIEDSRGTADMLCKAEDAGIPYCLIERA